MSTINYPIPDSLLEEIYSLPNQAGVRALINQTCLGEVFPMQPSTYVVLKTMDAYCYLAGIMNDHDLKELIQFFNTFPEICLVCDERHHAPLIKMGMKPCARIELFYKEGMTQTTTNPFLKIKQITTSEFGIYCPWFKFVTGLYGSEDMFFKNGFGSAVCDGDTILSACYAAHVGDNHCELAIATHPEHEGKGMATFAVKACVEECLKRGLIPEWSCNSNHPASLRVALKSGFVINRYYAFLKLT